MGEGNWKTDFLHSWSKAIDQVKLPVDKLNWSYGKYNNVNTAILPQLSLITLNRFRDFAKLSIPQSRGINTVMISVGRTKAAKPQKIPNAIIFL